MPKNNAFNCCKLGNFSEHKWAHYNFTADLNLLKILAICESLSAYCKNTPHFVYDTNKPHYLLIFCFKLNKILIYAYCLNPTIQLTLAQILDSSKSTNLHPRHSLHNEMNPTLILLKYETYHNHLLLLSQT